MLSHDAKACVILVDLAIGFAVAF